MPSEESANVAAEANKEVKEDQKSGKTDNKEAEGDATPNATATGATEANAAETQNAANAATPTAAQPASPPAPPKPTVHKPNFEKDVVYLYQFSRTPVIPSVSACCLQVETWLRLANIKYENVDHKTKFRSKKGQLPFIEVNGEEISSPIIVRELAQKFEKDLDSGLDKDQKNVAHAITSMIENHLSWVVMWWRTKYPDEVIKGYKISLQHQIGNKLLPNRLLNLFFKFSYGRKGAKKVKAQGIGIHSPEEILACGQNDLKVLSDTLADKPFFFGDEPTTLDVVAFANLAQIYFIDKEISFPLRDYMQENCANLVGHVNRMKERCFPDWEEMCNNLDMNSHLPKPPPEEKEKEKEKEKKEGKEEEKSEKEGDKEIEKEIEKEKTEKEAEKDVEENKEKEAAK